MSNTLGRKLVSLILAAMMVCGCMVTVINGAGEAAETTSDGQDSGSEKKTLVNINDVATTMTYDEYLSLHKSAKKASESIVVDPTDYDAENTTAEVEVLSEYSGKTGRFLKTGNAGRVTFNISVPESGFYSLKIAYAGVDNKTNSIERSLYIDGQLPFTQARSLYMKKSWVNEYTEQEDGTLRFAKDTSGNESRPIMNVDNKWQEYTFVDSNGYSNGPLMIYFEAGEHKIGLESIREPLIIGNMELGPADEIKSYEKVLEEYERSGYTPADVEPIYLDAEMPSAVSDYRLYPLNDRMSSKTEPQSSSATLLNTIGSYTYATNGQWIEYTFDVEKSGLYTFMMRYRQNEHTGVFVSRRLYIDGEIPFAEAEYLKFNYLSSWQTGNLTDGNTDFQFYLEEGTHTIRLEVTLGAMSDLIRRVSEVQSSVNEDYLTILRLTGAEPDEYRDYGFGRIMPDTMRDLVSQADKLDAVVAELEEMSNVKSDNTASLEQISSLLRKMGTDEDQIAKNLSTLKTDLGSLGSWILGMVSQPLELDYIMVQSIDDDVPKAEGGFIDKVVHEVKQFFFSFFTDYNSLSTAVEEGEAVKDPIVVWTAAGRDKAQVAKTLIDRNFVPESGIPVVLNLVDKNTLLPAILAGIGPDVALEGMTNTDAALSTNTTTTTSAGSIIDYAIRGAVLPIQDMEGFDEVKTRFPESCFDPISLYGETYGLPATFNFNMMFYRTDILSQLGLEVPETWDDLMSMVRVLQFNNMELGVPSDVGGFGELLYQMGGSFWADDGMRINFDDNTSLEAFETMCNMFTQYSLPLTFDASNRFRTGEVPIFIGQYSTSYNNIIIFATELAGLWSFGPIPGTYDENGNLNRTTIGSCDAVIMLRGCEAQDDAWEFMKWYTDTDFQVQYSNELVTVMGEAAKNNPANIEALEQLSWTVDEYRGIYEQAQNVVCLQQFPGSYFITRYINFAVAAAYNEQADPVETLLGYVSAINKEISRKREEFGYETLEPGQTLAEKRMEQAAGELDGLSSSDADNYKSEIESAKNAISLEDADALNRSAEALLSANSETFGTAAGYLKDAAAALESYKTNNNVNEN